MSSIVRAGNLASTLEVAHVKNDRPTATPTPTIASRPRTCPPTLTLALARTRRGCR